MTDINKYIDASNKKENKEICMNEFQEFKKMLRDYENLLDDFYEGNLDKHKLDKKYENKLKASEITPCSLTAVRDTDVIKEAFHDVSNLDEIRSKFIKQYDKDLPIDVIGWVYKVFEFVKENTNT